MSEFLRGLGVAEGELLPELKLLLFELLAAEQRLSTGCGVHRAAIDSGRGAFCLGGFESFGLRFLDLALLGFDVLRAVGDDLVELLQGLLEHLGTWVHRVDELEVLTRVLALELHLGDDVLQLDHLLGELLVVLLQGLDVRLAVDDVILVRLQHGHLEKRRGHELVLHVGDLLVHRWPQVRVHGDKQPGVAGVGVGCHGVAGESGLTLGIKARVHRVVEEVQRAAALGGAALADAHVHLDIVEVESAEQNLLWHATFDAAATEVERLLATGVVGLQVGVGDANGDGAVVVLPRTEEQPHRAAGEPALDGVAAL